ncbi:hypothetical protein BT96DRAFT_1002159 [Gymnopus androsaceus JB14]|uniref:F-box domain-containing protein n=1 Tax=Gymnopus androsaceus JB14 TaxID=1447944 RepID=A0A6A4GYN5_9AGAR|nr:hypothetical protein BT96DRAFT_1002159 [Gymnopus androsaceus JB14]
MLLKTALVKDGMLTTSLYSMPLPDQFAAELIDECLSHLDPPSLFACTSVSRIWRDCAKLQFMSEIDLTNNYQVKEIQHSAKYRPHVRSIISPINPPTPIHQNLILDIPACPMRIRKLEFYGSSLGSPEQQHQHPFIFTFLDTFHTTLTSFISHNSMIITGDAFFSLLHALGQCPNLSCLTLPCPRTSMGTYYSGLPWKETTRMIAQPDRPKITYLQIMSTWSRYAGSLDSVEEPGKNAWQWLSNELCPLDLSSVKELVVGSPGAVEILLPILCGQAMNNFSMHQYIYLASSTSMLVFICDYLVGSYPSSVLQIWSFL